MPPGLYTDNDQQCQQRSRGIRHELDLQSADVRTGQRRLSRGAGKNFDRPRVQQQQDGREDGQHEFHEDPLMPEQAPLGAE